MSVVGCKSVEELRRWLEHLFFASQLLNPDDKRVKNWAAVTPE